MPNASKKSSWKKIWCRSSILHEQRFEEKIKLCCVLSANLPKGCLNIVEVVTNIVIPMLLTSRPVSWKILGQWMAPRGGQWVSIMIHVWSIDLSWCHGHTSPAKRWVSYTNYTPSSLTSELWRFLICFTWADNIYIYTWICMFQILSWWQFQSHYM